MPLLPTPPTPGSSTSLTGLVRIRPCLEPKRTKRDSLISPGRSRAFGFACLSAAALLRCQVSFLAERHDAKPACYFDRVLRAFPLAHQFACSWRSVGNPDD